MVKKAIIIVLLLLSTAAARAEIITDSSEERAEIGRACKVVLRSLRRPLPEAYFSTPATQIGLCKGFEDTTAKYLDNPSQERAEIAGGHGFKKGINTGVACMKYPYLAQSLANANRGGQAQVLIWALAAREYNLLGVLKGATQNPNNLTTLLSAWVSGAAVGGPAQPLVEFFSTGEPRTATQYLTLKSGGAGGVSMLKSFCEAVDRGDWDNTLELGQEADKYLRSFFEVKK